MEQDLEFIQVNPVSTKGSRVRQQRRMKWLRREVAKLRLQRAMLVILCMILIVIISVQYKKSLTWETQIADLEAELESEKVASDSEYSQLNSSCMELQVNYENICDEYDAMYEEYEEMYNYTLECESVISQLYDILLDIQDENDQLIESNDEYYEALLEYQEREELYDKYSYCLTYGGERTDITYDQLETVETLCEDKGVDTDLVLAIVMVESCGDETASNSSSSARGYGQFLKSSGEYVYEELMNAGTYDHSLAYDGTINLTMMVNYLDYLIDSTGSVTTAISRYRGETGSVLTSYINKINSYLESVGKSVYSISIE